MPQDILIPAPEGSKYLSEIFNIHTAHGPTLPKNCLFDKVTTGCGGSYVALTSPEPTIIAVPTKALVRDKVTQEKYKRFNILGISQEFPIPEAIPADCSKIICTYQSLPSLAAKLTISNWNLVVDEMHLLTRMISFSKKPLRWLLDNFKSFKSYCFMSATIPKEEHLLPQLKEIDRVTMHWPGLCKVSFECYHAENLQDSILQIIAEHLDGTRPGNAYFFYNSIAGICSLIKLIRKLPEGNTLCAAITATTKSTADKLRRVGCKPVTPDQHSKINFVTSAAFEGVDFYDKEGVSYIISDSRYQHTKYSIVTTIPQIVGRLRESVYNSKVTVLFNNQELVDSRTEEEFEAYINTRLIEADGEVKTYDEARVIPGRERAVRSILAGAVQNMYIEFPEKEISLEDIDNMTAEFGDIMKVFPEAAILERELYDLLRSNVYLPPSQGGSPEHFCHSLAETLGKASPLSADNVKLFKKVPRSLKTLCEMYIDDPQECQLADPEWFEVIDSLGVEKIKSYEYNKSKLRRLLDGRPEPMGDAFKETLKRRFKVGRTYPSEVIRNYLNELNGSRDSQATELKEVFEVRRTTLKGNPAYKIVRRL